MLQISPMKPFQAQSTQRSSHPAQKPVSFQAKPAQPEIKPDFKQALGKMAALLPLLLVACSPAPEPEPLLPTKIEHPYPGIVSITTPHDEEHVMPLDTVLGVEKRIDDGSCLVHLGKGLEEAIYLPETNCDQVIEGVFPAGSQLLTVPNYSGDMVTFDKADVAALEEMDEGNATLIKLAGDDDDTIYTNLPIEAITRAIYGEQELSAPQVPVQPQ